MNQTKKKEGFHYINPLSKGTKHWKLCSVDEDGDKQNQGHKY